MDGPVVVGTDGSETATIAVGAAIRLAKMLSQPLHLVSAYRPVELRSELPPEFEGCITSADLVDGIVADALASARAAGVEAVPHARTGPAADALLEVADEVDAAIIVVGNKGIRSKARYLLGNVPSKVVHNATCSTFVVQTT